MPLYFKFFACCIPVKGFLRTVIYDLQRKQYCFIPNEIFDLLDGSNRIAIPANGFPEFLNEVFEFLLKSEFGFMCNDEECELFPQLDLEYESFYDFDSMIIDLDLSYGTVINSFSNKNKNLLINALQLRFFFNPSICQLRDIIATFNNLNICSIELIIPYSVKITQNELEIIVDDYTKVTSISIFSSPQKELLCHKQSSINYLQETIVGESDCGKIDESLFCCNLLTFCESQKFNTCLNKKISIDINGKIKNCPSCKQTFGDIDQKSLVELNDHLDFKRVWGVSKNQIDVCKDCEFRHMCTDCRAYIKDPNNIYSQPAKCNYNPYIAKWKGEEGFVPVEECGTYSIETGFVVTREKVEAINLELWGS